VTTEFSARIEILSSLKSLFGEGEAENFRDFCNFHDIGLPLAYLVSADLCELNQEGKKYINETFKALLSTLSLDDGNFSDLDELLNAAGMFLAAKDVPSGAAKSSEMTLIGSIAIDSGQAMVGDPCYLDKWQTNEGEPFELDGKQGDYSYLGACATTISQTAGELGSGSSVVFNTGYGDGVYPVFADINEEGQVKRVLIEFIDE